MAFWASVRDKGFQAALRAGRSNISLSPIIWWGEVKGLIFVAVRNMVSSLKDIRSPVTPPITRADCQGPRARRTMPENSCAAAFGPNIPQTDISLAY